MRIQALAAHRQPGIATGISAALRQIRHHCLSADCWKATTVRAGGQSFPVGIVLQAAADEEANDPLPDHRLKSLHSF